MAKKLKFGPEGPVAKAFVPGDLNRVCTMAEENFGRAYGLTKYNIKKRKHSKHNFFFFRDNGSDVLAVAHLDTVANANDAQSLAKKRAAHFMNTEAGPLVYSRALDDRLGAYIILELLPKLGINCDILLTVGEEVGQSTAEFFSTDKQYNWMIEFDRGGTDVVMYQYGDTPHEDLIRAVGAKVGKGSFSDICELDHLNCRGFNWGTGYQEYHTAKAHAYLNDTFEMVTRFLRFHEVLYDVHMPYDKKERWTKSSSKVGRSSYGGYQYGEFEYHNNWDVRPRPGSNVKGTTGPQSPTPKGGYVGSPPGGGTSIPRGSDPARSGSRYGSSVSRDYSQPLPKSSLPENDTRATGMEVGSWNKRASDVADELEGDSTPKSLLPVPITDPFMVSDEHPGVLLSKAEQEKVLAPILGPEDEPNGPEDLPEKIFPD